MRENGNAAVRIGTPRAGANLAGTRSALQNRAPGTVRRHGARGVRRVLVLLSADCMVTALVHQLLVLVRDFGVLGGWLASTARSLVPAGFLGGPLFLLALTLGLLAMGNYGRGDLRRDPQRLLRGAVLGTALVLWSFVWARGFELTLIQFAAVIVPLWPALVLGRRTVDRMLERYAGRHAAARTVLVGSLADCRAMLASCSLFSRPGEYEVIGFVTTGPAPVQQALGRVEDLGRIVDAESIEAVFIAGKLTRDQTEHVIDLSLAAGCELLTSAGPDAAGATMPHLRWHDGEPVIALSRPSLRARDMLLKRGIDMVLSLFILSLLIPLLLLIAVVIALSSPGPVLFRQKRVGQGGRVFTMYKFRTMRVDAERLRDQLAAHSLYSDRRLFKIDRDPRVTRVGSLLRKLSLDELPQLWNVVCGDMSLVGPRPPIPEEVVHYEDHHYCRFDVKPGMTGPWQVGGRNLVRDFDEVVRLEKAYIQNWSLARDIRILVQTVPAVLRTNETY